MLHLLLLFILPLGTYGLGCNNVVNGHVDTDETSIAETAFFGCSELKSINMPSVTSIGNFAFAGCHNLVTVNMPSVTSINGSAFEGCSELIIEQFDYNTISSYHSFAGIKFITTIESENCLILSGLGGNNYTDINDYIGDTPCLPHAFLTSLGSWNGINFDDGIDPNDASALLVAYQNTGACTS